MEGRAGGAGSGGEAHGGPAAASPPSGLSPCPAPPAPGAGSGTQGDCPLQTTADARVCHRLTRPPHTSAVSPDFLNARVALQIKKGLILTRAVSGQRIRFLAGETEREAPAPLEPWTCPQTPALSLGHTHAAGAAPYVDGGHRGGPGGGAVP